MSSRTLYLYDEKTGELLDSCIQRESPIEPGVFFEVPNSTTLVPPNRNINTCVIFSNGTWILEDDYRGQIWYDQSGIAHTIDRIGMPDISLSSTPPTAVVLANNKASKKLNFSSNCSAQITAGFNSAALGTSYTYPGSTIDQMNVTLAIVSGGPLWCMDTSGVWGFKQHTLAQAQEVQKDMATTIQSIRTKYADLVTKIDNATTLAELETIIW